MEVSDAKTILRMSGILDKATRIGYTVDLSNEFIILISDKTYRSFRTLDQVDAYLTGVEDARTG